MTSFWVFLAIATVAVFSFISIAVWVESRRKEREAFYKYQLLRKIADSPDSGGAALTYLKETERAKAARIREGTRIGGVISTLAAAGVMVFLRFVVPNQPIYLAGLIPLLAGVGLLTYRYRYRE